VPLLLYGFEIWPDDHVQAAILFWVAAPWLIYSISKVFPQLIIRYDYRRSRIRGERYVADVDAEGFAVQGADVQWRVKWSAVEFKAEDDVVFALCAANSIFMFGKRFLTDGQQAELRTLMAGAGAAEKV